MLSEGPQDIELYSIPAIVKAAKEAERSTDSQQEKRATKLVAETQAATAERIADVQSAWR